MKYLAIKAIFSLVILMVFVPTVSMAQPAGPGGGDPFATPVNGGIAFVAVISFMYGAYRLYKMNQKSTKGG